MFSIEIENEPEFRAGWERLVSAVTVAAMRGVSMGCREGAAEARTRHAFKSRTGTLEQSISGRIINSSGPEPTGEIVASAKYASFVEGGTSPHEIEPRRGTFLHWEEPQGDHHFARVVHHPGTKSLPFMGIAYLKCQAVMTREIEKGFSEAQAILDRD